MPRDALGGLRSGGQDKTKLVEVRSLVAIGVLMR
jgi:hypothetical protein